MERFISLMLVLAFLTACSQDEPSYPLYESPGHHFSYDPGKPGQLWKLPLSLLEISGISYIDDKRLACIQDEKGVIFIFNTNSGKIESEINFGESGDYEDITIIGKDAWILKSNGTLYKAADFLTKKKPDVMKYATALSSKNDAEGLAFDPETKSLLIACKEEPYLDETKGKGLRAIYSFDLENLQLDPEPFLMISLDSVRYYRTATGMAKPAKGEGGFKPSGLAIHPATGEIYVLAAAGSCLMVMTREGKILSLVHLSPSVFPQPEGICFSPAGVLYISSEGAGKDGRIVKFTPVN